MESLLQQTAIASLGQIHACLDRTSELVASSRNLMESSDFVLNWLETREEMKPGRFVDRIAELASQFE